MTRYLHHDAIKSPRQHHCQHNSASISRRAQVVLASLSPAWLSIYITQRPSSPGSTVTSMTRQQRRQHDSTSTSHHDQVTPTSSLLAWLNDTITSMTRQHRHQHDSTSTSHRAHVVPAAPSLAWLGIYIAPSPAQLGSTIASTTRQQHHAIAWSTTSITYDFSGKQTRCQLISILFTDILASRANANVSLRSMAPLDTSIF
jgi:hypothetical protein